MYLILKATYTIITENYAEGLLISHLFEDDHQSVKLGNQIDREKVKNGLVYGMNVPTGQDTNKLSDEEKTVITIIKKLPDHFMLTEKNDILRKQANIRGVLIRAAESNVAPSIMKDYVDYFDEQPIYISRHDSELKSYLVREGLPGVQSLSEVNTAINRKGIILVDDDYIPSLAKMSNVTYLLYSLDQLRAGPLLIPGVTICLDCYDAYYRKEQTPEMFPVYHRNFIMNFLVNTVYYCINDLFRFMSIDIGLPLRKYYELSVRNLSMSVQSVYKMGACPTCASHLNRI